MPTTAELADLIQIDGLSKPAEAMRAVIRDAEPMIARAVITAGVRIRLLMPGEKFGDVSRDYRSRDDMKFAVCRGLYVPDDKIIVLKYALPSVMIHECMHIIDLQQGQDGKFRSHLDDDVQRAYHTHKKSGYLISNYAGSAVHEFFAETARAALGYSETSPGRPTDQQRLMRIDPALMQIVQNYIDTARTQYASQTLEMTP